MNLSAFVRNLISLITPERWTASHIQQQPAPSVGRWYRRMGSNDCWEATGVVRQTFTQISVEINQYLEKYSPDVDPIVTWSVFMIGKTENTAIPTILFCCSRREPRKLIRTLVEESRILDRYPGFNVGDCSTPPDFHQLVPLSHTVQPLTGYDHAHMKDSDAKDHAEKTVLFTPTRIIPGTQVFFKVTQDENNYVLRKATIGAMFHKDGKYYATTVGHLFAQDVHIPETAEESDSEFEYDIAGQVEREERADFLIDFTEKDSTTNHDNGSPSYSAQPFERLESHATNSLQPQLCSFAADQKWSEQLDRNQHAPCPTMERANRALVATPETPNTSQSQLDILGRVVYSASGDHSTGLDYALIEIDDRHVQTSSTGLRKAQILNYSQIRQVVGREPTNTPVMSMTSSAGLLTGTISGTPSFMRWPWADYFQEVWTVHFNGPLAKGDCGSLVVDATSKKFYGHIVAGSPVSGVAYIVPACQVFENLNKCFNTGQELVAHISQAADRNEPQDPFLNTDCSRMITTRGSEEHSDSIRPAQARREAIARDIDSSGYNIRVMVVAAIGVFSDSYNIFATNMIIPILSIVYFGGASGSLISFSLASSVLCGILIGQIMFGLMADIWGRRTYGIELFIIIAATIGMSFTTQSSGTMMISCLTAWRFIMGIGIGGDYPLSAVVTAEWAPRRHRGRMLSAIFFSQPLGHSFAALVALFAAGLASKSIPLDATIELCDNHCMNVLDKTWRLVVILGALPALVALTFRITLPESPRYTIDVNRDQKTQNHIHATAVIRTAYDEMAHPDQPPLDGPNSGRKPRDGWKTFGRKFSVYMMDHGGWRPLIGTSLSWLLLDTAFYGLGMNSIPLQTSSVSPNIWRGVPIETLITESPSQSLRITTVGAIVGSWFAFIMIDFMGRRRLQMIGFFSLSLTLFLLGAWYFFFPERSNSVALFLWLMCQVFFNFGPNTTTFLIPAEIFPTRFRCTSYGISAAVGKIGSLVAQYIFMQTSTPPTGGWTFSPYGFSRALISVSALMLLGALVTWIWIPETKQNALSGPTMNDWSASRLDRRELRKGERFKPGNPL